jgi:ABC-type nitrate/sulfonate/bicarbonate transport system permease component
MLSIYRDALRGISASYERMRTELRTAFVPTSNPNIWWSAVAAWVTIFLVYWVTAAPIIFPSPIEVLQALPTLWNEGGLGQELLSSLTVNVEALLLTLVVTLLIAYTSRVPAVKPLGVGISKLRFVSPAVFFLLLLFITDSGQQLKVVMLAMGETFFLMQTMLGVVRSIPEYKFDDARTLRMSEWKTTWYVVIRGTLAETIDAVRDIEAMGWSMLLMVEGYVRSGGGVGVMTRNFEKHQDFAQVYAIALAIILVGIAKDYGFGLFKSAACPWTVKR